MHSSLFNLPLRTLPVARITFVALVFMGIIGCDGNVGNSVSDEAPSSYYSQQMPDSAARDSSGKLAEVTSGYAVVTGGAGGGQAYGGGPGAQDESVTLFQTNANQVASSVDRKIIYQTQISLVVKEYQSFEAGLPKLVDSFQGFVAKSASNRRYQNQQNGEWVVRIPVANYVNFLSGINGLGFAESRQEDAQDVTDQFVDIDARIRNSKRLEERIIKMVDERAGKMSDVLEIERELARVRQDIERMEGQLRLLGDRSAMATVTIRCREEKEYSPPAAPTYLSRVQSSWGTSVDKLVDFFGNGFIAVVSGIPWFITFCTPVAIGIWYVRWRLIQRKIAKPMRDASSSI